MECQHRCRWLGTRRLPGYRGATQVGTTATTSFSDTGLTPSTQYCYTVVAYDNAGNTSAASSSVCATTLTPPDTTKPTVSITNSSATYTNAQTVTITASATDNIGVTKVEIYDGATLKTTGTSYAWTFTSANNGAHNWTARAYDAAGNVTTSAVVTLTVNIDVSAPTVPAGLTATAVSTNQINLSWSASTDTGGSGLAGYKVYRGGVQIATTASTSYSDTGLSASNQYCYTVTAYDNAGNTSAQSSQALRRPLTPPDTTIPTITFEQSGH